MEFSTADIKNFKRAETASNYSDFHKNHTGAVIMYGNKVLSIGWNTDKELMMQKKYNKYRNTFDVNQYRNCGHAEMWALNRLKKTCNLQNIDKNKLSIYVWRNSNGKRALAKPCIACTTALKDFGIKHIYYTGNDSFIYEELK